MSLGTPTNCSFGGVAFFMDQMEEMARPLFDDQTNYSLVDVPFGTRHIVQLAGEKTATQSIEILVPSSLLAAFRAKRKATGTLNILGASRTATLLDITNYRDSNLAGYVRCTALWMSA